MNNLKISIFNSINSSLQQKNSFKGNLREEKREEYRKYLEKYNYIDSKTRDLFYLSNLLLFTSLFLNVHNIDFSKKLKVSEKFGIGTLVACGITIIANCIKRYKLSKEYHKEMNK